MERRKSWGLWHFGTILGVEIEVWKNSKISADCFAKIEMFLIRRMGTGRERNVRQKVLFFRKFLTIEEEIENFRIEKFSTENS